MNRMFRILFLFLFVCGSLMAQDIEKVSKSKPITPSGGINASTVFYYSDAEQQQRDPFYWALNGNFNLNIYNVINVPVSFLLSKENKTFNQPSYKQFGLSPKYKSLTLHGGHRNMMFSKYTLSGITFLGGGFEYAPKNSLFKIKGFYGRFAKAHRYTPVSAFNTTEVIEPASFERWGYGTMVTFGKKKHLFDFIFFRAFDDKNSVDYMPEESGVKPGENFILGFNTKNSITKRLKFKMEYSLSAYSSDTRVPEQEQETYSYINNLGFLFTPRQSSAFNSAINSSLNYSFTKTNVGISFRRIGPDYMSMGTAFLNNDIQEVTADFASSFLKNKLMVSVNAGSQSNNLDKSLITTTKRFISSLNCTWLVNKKLNFVAVLSNFNTNSNPERVYLADSIKYAQVTQNYSLSGNYNMGDSIVHHNFSLNTTYQNVNTLNHSGTQISDITTDFFNSILSYTLALNRYDMLVISSVNYSTFTTQDVITTTIGPALGVNRRVYKEKIRLGLTGTYLNTNTDGDNKSQIFNLRLNADYSLNKHHKFRFICNLLGKQQNTGNYNRAQANISYNYNF